MESPKPCIVYFQLPLPAGTTYDGLTVHSFDAQGARDVTVQLVFPQLDSASYYIPPGGSITDTHPGSLWTSYHMKSADVSFFQQPGAAPIVVAYVRDGTRFTGFEIEYH